MISFFLTNCLIIIHLSTTVLGHTDNDVEHVQEPEESDVCLIPDDEETEVTDAEREKARQVREVADKEDEEQMEKAESKIYF